MDKEKQYEMVCNACFHHIISVSFFRNRFKITDMYGSSASYCIDYFPFYLEPNDMDKNFLLSQYAGNDFYYYENDDRDTTGVRLEYSHYKNLFHIFRDFFK